MGLRFIFMLTRNDRTVEDASEQLKTALSLGGLVTALAVALQDRANVAEVAGIRARERRRDRQ